LLRAATSNPTAHGSRKDADSNQKLQTEQLPICFCHVQTLTDHDGRFYS
jgi:hypothetical protein